MPSTTQFIQALTALGVVVLDLRGQLPEHATKRFATRDATKLRGLTAHHSAGPAGGRQQLEAVARYHVGANHVSATGCPGLLYTMAVLQDGSVALAHDLEVATWSQGDKARPGDENAEFMAVLTLGNFHSADNPTGNEPSPDQLWAFACVVRVARQLWGKGFDVTGHFQFGKPACPGATLEAVVRAMAKHVERPAPPAQVATLRDVQVALLALGYDAGTADGQDGPRTRGAVAAFQRDHGLPVDGAAGPQTKAALAAEAQRRG